MRKHFMNTRIPTAVGLVLLIGCVMLTSWVVEKGFLLGTRANQTATPQEMRISNVTDSSFTVSYITGSAVTGQVLVKDTNNNTLTVIDDRDRAAQTSQEYAIHYITVEDLQPESAYTVTLVSDGTPFLDEDNAVTVTTGKSLPTPTGSQQVKGSVILPNGDAPQEAIAYVQNDASQIVSTPIQKDGTFTFPLQSLRDTSLSEFANLADDDLITIEIFGDGLQSEITATVKDAATLPPISLSSTYDFAELSQISLETDEGSPSAETEADESFPDFTENNSLSKNPQILTPKKDQTFTDVQPRFSGTALPQRTVEITINSSHAIKATIQADRNGNWTYRPSQPLEPGEHTITIATRDESGIMQTILQSFVVNAQGSQFVEPSVSPTRPVATATPRVPSPTIPQATPTRTPTISQTSQITLTPTRPLPTATATLTPTITPTATPTIPPPSISPMGSNGTLIFMSIAGIAVLAGSVLFFLAQGGLL